MTDRQARPRHDVFSVDPAEVRRVLVGSITLTTENPGLIAWEAANESAFK